MVSDYTVRIWVHPNTQVFRKPDVGLLGHHRPFDEQDRVLDYRPVEGPVLMSGGLEAALSSLTEIVRDAVNQANWETSLDVHQLLADAEAVH